MSRSQLAVMLAVVLLGAAAPAQTLSEIPPGNWTPIQQKPVTFDVAAQLKSQFSAARRLVTAAADRMPAEDYAFAPATTMRSFGANVAHVAQSNFGYCANLTGQPAPHKGEDLEKTAADKAQAMALLKESFDFCSTFVAGITTETMNGTYQAGSTGPDGQKGTVEVARGGLLSNLIAHNNEMYGYMAVYLRMKGLVPPSSDPRPARGRGVGPGGF